MAIAQDPLDDRPAQAILRLAPHAAYARQPAALHQFAISADMLFVLDDQPVELADRGGADADHHLGGVIGKAL
ncbi:hypothetical protein LTR94_038234, partial [Friedmanniomyces endolithicus]